MITDLANKAYKHLIDAKQFMDESTFNKLKAKIISLDIRLSDKYIGTWNDALQLKKVISTPLEEVGSLEINLPNDTAFKPQGG